MLVTGASGAIGRVVARHLGELGASLILVGRDPERMASVLETLGTGDHRSIAFDVRDEHAWRDARSQLEVGGGISGLVTAAGQLGPIGPIGSYPIDAFRDTVDANVTGTLLAISTFVSDLVAAEGSVVTFSGGGATSPLPRYSAYAASKAAVVRLTENLAVELAPAKVRVNAVAPGFIVSAMHDETLRAGEDAVGEEYFARTARVIAEGGDSPSDAAELVGFLLSDAAAGITGRLISAVWDPWRTADFQQQLRDDRDLATLRRIDDQFFEARR